MVSLQKDVNIIKIDVMKNQNLIAEVIDRYQTSRDQRVENVDRSKLKIPLQTMVQLDSLEADEELKQIFVCLFFVYLYYIIKYIFFSL